jgi:hypothetical protein
VQVSDLIAAVIKENKKKRSTRTARPGQIRSEASKKKEKKGETDPTRLGTERVCPWRPPAHRGISSRERSPRSVSASLAQRIDRALCSVATPAGRPNWRASIAPAPVPRSLRSRAKPQTVSVVGRGWIAHFFFLGSLVWESLEGILLPALLLRGAVVFERYRLDIEGYLSDRKRRIFCCYVLFQEAIRLRDFLPRPATTPYPFNFSAAKCRGC